MNSEYLPSAAALQQAEQYLKSKGWVETAGIATSKFWRKLNDGYCHPTIYAMGIQAIDDLCRS